MDHFVLFGLGDSNRPCHSFDNNVSDSADFSLFDISTTRSSQQQPENNRTGVAFGSTHIQKEETDSRNGNSSASRKTKAIHTAAKAEVDAFEEGLKLVKVDWNYTLRSWLKEGPEEGQWTTCCWQTLPISPSGIVLMPFDEEIRDMLMR
jgi:hypothetical protein